MKIYNKFVESKKEPSNKNDIWFDGSSWNMYKEGMWRSFTLPLDAAVEINKILQEDKSVLQQELKNYLKIQDSPFGKGEADNSAILKGGNNQVISEGGVALGKDNLVGLKGWYYSSIYKENDNTIFVYLSNEQKAFNSDEDFKTESQTADESLPNLVEILGVNAVISLVNAGKYDDKFIVIGGSNGVVRLQTIDESVLPFDIITGQSVINYEDYSIYCLSKPDAGIADIGKYSFAVGYNNKTTNGESTAFGCNNHAYGKFSFVEGKDNKAGYASHAEGRSNIASGSMSHAEGRNNVASGSMSHAEGGNNIAKGVRSHAEGNGTKANGINSHAEGEFSQANGKASHAEGFSTEALGESSHAEGNDTKAEGINSHAEGYKSHSLGPHSHAEGNETKAEGSCAHAEGYKSQALGKYSHAEGNNTIAKNEAEHACGKYNSSTQSNDSAQATRFSIGIGTSDTNRKNAVEVKRNGDVYIIGVGGYDGTNPIESKDLATVINNLENKHPLLGFANDDINNSKSSLDLIYSLIKLNNLSPYIQGWGNFVCKDDLSFSGTYTILSVGTVNAKASAILKVVGSIFGSGFNSYIVQVSFSVDVNENYSNLEVTATEEFNSTETLNRITQLENKLNEITTSETN